MQAICDILEIDFEDVKDQVDEMQEEKDTANAKAKLEGVVTDEQTAEDSSATIPE